MANEVVINVKAETGEAVKDFSVLQNRVRDMSKQTGGLTEQFGGLNKRMLAFGLGTLGAAFSVQKLLGSMSSVADQNATLEFTLARLPTVMLNRFSELSPLISSIAEQFGVTEKQAQQAMATILAVSRNPTVGMEELAAALGFVARGEMSVQAAALLVGRALSGDISAIRQITQDWGSLDNALAASARTGLDAVTAIDDIGLGLKEFVEAIAGAFNAISKLDLGAFIKSLGPIGENMKKALQPIFDTIEKIVTLGGIIEFGFKLGRIPGLIQKVMDVPGGVMNTVSWSIDFAVGKVGDLIQWVWDRIASGGDSLSINIDLLTTTVSDWLERIWKWIEEGMVGLSFRLSTPTVSAWIERVWDWLTVGIVGLQFRLSTPTIAQWFGRIWGWIQEGMVGLSFRLSTPTVSAWIERIWSWIKNGVSIGIDFFTRTAPTLPFGGGIPGILPFAPFAHGGIVRKPTLAMLGESGPEAVIPLNQGRGMGGDTIINIYGDIDSEIRLNKIVRNIKELLATDIRRGLAI